MTRTAIFVGDGSLLIECAAQFQARGGAIVAVISGNSRVVDWAQAANISTYGAARQPDLSNLKADFLFSVANLNVLPPELLAAADTMAINFHDGPLPGYSGLNVTSWAILKGAASHRITWHEMTERVDAGRILVEREVSIAADETAFSLNTKCYGAGLSAFAELLEDVFLDNLAGRPQVGQRNWFGRDKRPTGRGYLDFSQSAADLSALVRALDFGPYANTLTLPKLWTGERAFVVRLLEIGQSSSAAGGTVLTMTNESVTVATSSDDVILRGFETLDGLPIDIAEMALRVGSRLSPKPLGSNDENKKAISAETCWIEEFAGLKAAAVPYAKPDNGHAGIVAVRDVSMPIGLSMDQICLAFGLWIGLNSGETRFSMVVPARSEDGQSLASQAIVDLALDPEDSIAATLARFAASRSEARQISAELIARLPEGSARNHARAVTSIAVAASATTSKPSEILAGRRLVLNVGGDLARLIASNSLFDPESFDRVAERFAAFVRAFATDSETKLKNLDLGAQADLAGPIRGPGPSVGINVAFEKQVSLTPDMIALEADNVVLTYAELDRRAATLAGALSARGAKAGAIVGLCLERSADLIVSILAILKTGAAYLPLDPAYPVERITFMVNDSGTKLIVSNAAIARKLMLDQDLVVGPDEKGEQVATTVGELAYLIYTSGSTGVPKGVMVGDHNVMNFMTGMDDVVPHRPGARLLAVTSVSFDISVLEILWTLTRGLTVVLQTDGVNAGAGPEFSLFYFASEAAGTGHHAYRLLLEGAKFADENGFEAIWTPERHFHAFGGLYPNPAISSAAVAGFTKNVKIRAGSIVLPLHHPVRAAEDWALVDNLSGGRAGMAIASGWQPNDFILQPQNFDARKDVMLQGIDTIRALWRGEAVEFPNHKGEMIKTTTLPRPVQTEIPLWITAAGNPETFAAAARKGCGVLTHLLGQTFDEVAEKIRAYRVAWAEAGHRGDGTVTLMLHTFVGDDEASVRETVREPMRSYLKSAVDLVKRAAWSFPTFVQKASATGMTPQQVFEKEELSKEETDALLDHAFNRYYRESGLFGTPESCVEIVRNVASIGVDEIACLIDFGVDTDLALKHLHHIKVLMDLVKSSGGTSRKTSVAEYVVQKNITHLQCTPSAASILMADPPGRTALGRLQAMLVGGEALAPELARGLRTHLPGVLLNMYGPTETTVWSSVARLDTVGETVPLGSAIANTTLSVRNNFGQSLPDGLPGELWIGGDGVTQGYWRRPDLTADRFKAVDGLKYYRTGDLVRRRGDELEFLGRIDNQVKIRGHRIELGEVEAKLSKIPGVRQAIVAAYADATGDKRLVGYVTALAGINLDAAAIRIALVEVLPDFMQPSIIVPLDRFPLTPNGKIDRKALPSPLVSGNQVAHEAKGAAESAIAEIWCEALGLQHVGVTDNFFDLGGHSLLVVQVQRRLKQKFGKEIPIVDMFRFSTIRALATQVSGTGSAAEDSAARRGQERALARRNRMGRRAVD